MEELKTCLREYRLPQRAINGRNRVPKAAFDQTGRHSLGDIRRDLSILLLSNLHNDQNAVFGALLIEADGPQYLI